jgi:hypothetical protein
MALALWCDLKDYGHAFDERRAILVRWKNGCLYFCRDHCVPAFTVAFRAACNSDRAEIILPGFSKPFTILLKDAGFEFDFLDDKSMLPKMFDAFFPEDGTGLAGGGQERTGGESGKKDISSEKDTVDARCRAGSRVEALISTLKDGPDPDDAEGLDGRLKGIQVLCCGGTDRGHAFDERETITVTLKSRKQEFCVAHCVTAFDTAFGAAGKTGESEIRGVNLGGSFIIRRNDSGPEHKTTHHDSEGVR